MAERNPAIGFIGVGTLGKGLALALLSHGYRVTAAHSRSIGSARWLADRVPECQVYETAQQLADTVDLVFITTPDSAIGAMAASVSWHSGQGVVHCCGAESTAILQPAFDAGADIGAFHPFQTFGGLGDPQEAASRLLGVTFAVSGTGWLAGYLDQLARQLGGRPIAISEAHRPLYHAAAVLGCGYLVALLQAAVETWQAMGFSAQQAMESLYPLCRATLDNMARDGAEASVTGPVVRGDVATVQSHIDAISQRLPQLSAIYATLAAASLSLAQQHGVSPDRIAAMQELIDRSVHVK